MTGTGWILFYIDPRSRTIQWDAPWSVQEQEKEQKDNEKENKHEEQNQKAAAACPAYFPC